MLALLDVASADPARSARRALACRSVFAYVRGRPLEIDGRRSPTHRTAELALEHTQKRSLEPNMLSRLFTARSETAALKRFVWPTIHDGHEAAVRAADHARDDPGR